MAERKQMHIQFELQLHYAVVAEWVKFHFFRPLLPPPPSPFLPSDLLVFLLLIVNTHLKPKFSQQQDCPLQLNLKYLKFTYTEISLNVLEVFSNSNLRNTSNFPPALYSNIPGKALAEHAFLETIISFSFPCSTFNRIFKHIIQPMFLEGTTGPRGKKTYPRNILLRLYSSIYPWWLCWIYTLF